MKLKIISLNIWFGGKLHQPLIDFLIKENADILMLQEVYRSKKYYQDKIYNSLIHLSSLLNFKYYYFEKMVSFIINGYKVNIGPAIISRYKLYDKQKIYLQKGLESVVFGQDPTNYAAAVSRIMLYSNIKIKNKQINLFSIHGVWGTDNKTNNERVLMKNRIVKAIKNKKTFILAGDFNLDNKNELYNEIEKYGVNIFRNKLKTTFNLKYKPNRDKIINSSAVDNIIVSPDLKIANYYCPQVDVSDHLPLVVILEI